ncbi:MAG: hypothetical protein NVS9B8_02860 [Candidatus Limnocylindrales bacterium]
MASRFRRPTARDGRAAIVPLLAIALVGQVGLASSAPGDPFGPNRPATSAAEPHDESRPSRSIAVPVDPAARLQPSIQFTEAESHAAAQIAFTPGERVAIGFAPRRDDPWTVDGGVPTTLPAGRLDGTGIRGQGPAPAALVDFPSGGTSAVAVTTASWTIEPPVPLSPPDAVVSSSGLRREIFGFLPWWQLTSSTLRLDYSKISTIAYFGVGVAGNGDLQTRNSDGTPSVGWGGWTSSQMTSILTAAHAQRTRVVLTIQSFAWNATGLARQQALLGSSAARLNLARQVAAAVRNRGADGVNLDFEPLAAGSEAQFTALVRTVRSELDRVHRGYQLTFDATGSIDNYPIAEATASGGADAILIMGYDYRSSQSSPVGSVAPLNGSGHDIRDTIAAYTARVSPGKLILGVPYYGRAWSTSGNALNATNTSDAMTGQSTAFDYATAADYLTRYGRRYDPIEQVAWTAYQRQTCSAAGRCVTSWRQLYIDDAAAIGAKYDLVNAYGLRGAGIWALGYDGTRPELWAAIQSRFVSDSTPPTAGIRNLAARQGKASFSVGWTGRDDVAVASYDVQVSIDGRAWVGWLTATTATSTTWRGRDGHDYAFRVRARDRAGNVGPWNVALASVGRRSTLGVGGFAIVRVDGLSIRAAASIGATRLGAYRRGDIVVIVGGPVTADGQTWYQVAGPLTAWGPVAVLGPPAWVSAGSSRWPYLAPIMAPNATHVAVASRPITKR